jgi:hypothetical protein
VQRGSPGDPIRNRDEACRGSVCALACCAALTFGCSTTFGATGTYSIHPADVATIGGKTSSMLDLGLFDQKAHLAVGVESQLLHRLTGRGDAGGQWRMLGLLGITHMPKPNESMIGYELLFKGGVARDATDSVPDVVGAVGGSFGVPLRLACPQPLWRSDDLAALGTYIVPELGFHALGLDDTLELTAGLSFRVHLWSAFMP